MEPILMESIVKDPVFEFIEKKVVVVADAMKKSMEGEPSELDLNCCVPDEATKQAELLPSDTVTVVYEELEAVSTEVVVSQVPPVILREESTTPTKPSATIDNDGSVKTKWREIESVSAPPIDIFELKDSYHIFAEVPGLSVKDISIDLSDNMFTLSGDKRDHPLFCNSPVKPGDVVVRQEINKKGRFKRVLELPDNADPSDVDVKYEEGLLQFKIRKIVVEEKQEEVVDEKQEEEEVTKAEAQAEGEGQVDGVEEGGAEDEDSDGANVAAAKKKQTKKMGKKRSSCSVQ